MLDVRPFSALALLLAVGCQPPGGSPPTIVQGPLDEQACVDQAVTFRVEAAGPGRLSYQWLRDGVEIPGADRPFLVAGPVGRADAGARFRCRVSSLFGQVESADATLAVDDSIETTRHFIRTADGWQLGLTRIAPRRPVAGLEPVLLVHGFLETGQVYSLDNRTSLAHALARRGFDVWALDLRGSGLSRRPGPWDLMGWTFNIDDFIHQDAPAAVDHVLATTGHRQLFWVGHSMGGLIGYAYLETESPEKVKGLVTLAGAGWFSGQTQVDPLPVTIPGNLFNVLVGVVGPFFLPDFTLPVGTVWRAGASGAPTPLAGRLLDFLDGDFGRITWSPQNMDEASISVLMGRGVENTGMNMVRQFAAWMADEDCYTYGPSPYDPNHAGTSDYHRRVGHFSYQRHLGRIVTPALLVAGEADWVIPAASVTRVHQELGSRDKTLRVLGRSYGDPVDVGHEDILAGLHAADLVQPLVGDWIAARAGAPAGP